MIVPLGRATWWERWRAWRQRRRLERRLGRVWRRVVREERAR